jgi:hypothetical protein
MALPHLILLPSLVNVILYSMDDLHQTQVEEDLVLFIAKEFVSSSFVKLPFFRRLVSR